MIGRLNCLENRIKYYRLQRGMTQDTLAKRLNVDKSTVSKWETNRAMPRTYKLLEVAKVLGCDLEDLLVNVNWDEEK